MRILYEPKVYLVGKTQPELDGFRAFLEDQGLDWPTPNALEIEEDWNIHSFMGGKEDRCVPPNQTLIEMFGRNCYMSYGNKAGSKTNEAYLNNLIGMNREGPALGS